MRIADQTIKISTTQFISFVTQEPEKQLTVVKDIKRKHEEGYGVPQDIYKQFRDELIRMHKKALPKEILDQLVLSQTERSRQEHYPPLVEGYKKFLGKKKAKWFKPPTGVWRHEDLVVNVSPELGLEWDNQKYAVKLYCMQKDNLNKRRAEIVAHLMIMAIPELTEKNIHPLVLCVRKGKAYLSGKSDYEQTILIEAQAKAFVSMYREL